MNITVGPLPLSRTGRTRLINPGDSVGAELKLPTAPPMAQAMVAEPLRPLPLEGQLREGGGGVVAVN